MIVTSGTSTTKASQAPSAPPEHVDMTIVIGNSGRRIEPALEMVDGSMPSVKELEFNELLFTTYSKEYIPLETKDGIKTRERALARLQRMSRSWIEHVCRKLLLPQDIVDNAGGQLYTSGSYRLGVHEPGADIDCILVAPEMCTRDDFFGSGYVPPSSNSNNNNNTNNSTDETNILQYDSSIRDPDSLAMRIKHHPDVTNFNAVEGAAVPILTFDWEGVNIDLLFARLTKRSVPPTLDIDDDMVLDGVDSATEKSLNGPRVTNLIAAAVSQTPERYQTFLKVVRCVRKWAKARGLYSNKMGYWGGVNINIAVAFCLQLYPNATSLGLLRKFFLVFKTWRWPNPILLCKPHDAKLGLQVWSPQQGIAAGGGGQHQRGPVAPMITPAYPAMNSTMSISRQTLQIFQEEFNRGHSILDRLWKQFKKAGSKMKMESDDGHHWLSELFEPSDFFIAYPQYLSMCIVASSHEDVQAWAGFVESRLRKLVSDVLGRTLPLSKIQLWPKKIEACICDKTAGESLSMEQRKNCLTYFIGFHIDLKRMRGDHLNLEQALLKFKEYDLKRYQPLSAGMDMLCRTFIVKHLPSIVFEGIYPSQPTCKLYAMKRRKQLRELDPTIQEAKRLAKLESLKQKMAALEEKKKRTAAAAAAANKRKASEMEAIESTTSDKHIKTEDTTSSSSTTGIKENVVVKKEGLATENEGVVKKENEGTSNSILLQDDEEDEEEEEENLLLESTLDNIKVEQEEGGDGDNKNKTREEAELDRQRLLAGEYKEEEDDDTKSGNDDNVKEEEEDDVDENPQLYEEGFRPMMSLKPEEKTVAEKEAEVLLKANVSLLSNHECHVLGSDGYPGGMDEDTKIINPFDLRKQRLKEMKRNRRKAASSSLFSQILRRDEERRKQLSQPAKTKKQDGDKDDDDKDVIMKESNNGNDDEAKRDQQQQDNDKDDVSDSSDVDSQDEKTNTTRVQLIFQTKFPHVVELDAFGLIVDKGDDDFTPSKKWIGRKAGFEFKLGERGLGYYRTGKPVVVPSNVAYF